MRTCHELEGHIVFYGQPPHRLGSVSDICFSTDGHCLGFVTEKKGFLHSQRFFLPISSVFEITNDRIYTNINVKQLTQIPKVTLSFSKLKQIWVRNKKGEILGLLEDVYFSDDTGIIVAYKLSDGFFSDLKGHKKQVDIQHSQVEVRKDTIVLNG